MLFVNLKSTDPRFNLALEEYLMTNFTDDIFMLWQNDKSVIVGKNQNTLAEIDSVFCSENNIDVVRRMSGGGAVYHDLNNINFTFIKTESSRFNDYYFFTEPIVSFLKSLEIDAELSGRNDILIDGKKISGNAQFMKNGRVLHHGTLLFSVSPDILEKALTVSPDKIKSKGIKSVKSRVLGIKNHLKGEMSATEFKNSLADYVLNREKSYKELDVNDFKDEIDKLKQEKYDTWEWNFGYSPKYDFSAKAHFDFGTVEINMHIGNDSIIENIDFYGDFFSKKDTSELSEILKNTKHQKKALEEKLKNIKIDEYIFGMKNEEFLLLLL